MRAFKALWGVAVAACLAMSLLLLTAGGAAATQPKCLVVGDGGSHGTLQAAVDAASPGDTLRVKGTCYGDTTISKNLTIIGQSNPAFGPATLNGGNSRPKPGSVVTVDEGINVAITGLTITGGSGSYVPERGIFGGGILNYGSLTLANATVSGNKAETGGGIANRPNGSLTLKNSTVTDNRGGGSDLQGGNGGIDNVGSLTLIDSTVAGNRGYFAAIGNGGSLTLIDSTVTANRDVVVGGIENGGPLRLINSTVSDNRGAFGGGISNSFFGSVTINNSTVVGNTAFQDEGEAGYGGGIKNAGSMTLTNSTIARNTVEEGRGGGISNRGLVTLNNSNVAENEATPCLHCFGAVQGGRGGGIENEAFPGEYQGSLILNGSSSVTENTATEHGGGILNHRSEGATITFGLGWIGTVSGNTPDDIFNE